MTCIEDPTAYVCLVYEGRTLKIPKAPFLQIPACVSPVLVSLSRQSVGTCQARVLDSIDGAFAAFLLQSTREEHLASVVFSPLAVGHASPVCCCVHMWRWSCDMRV